MKSFMRNITLTAVDINLDLIVTEECQRNSGTPSVSYHLQFIYCRDKHKYSHIILRKTPKHIIHPLLLEISRLSLACSDRIQEIRLWKWHFCQQTVKTFTWQQSISWRLQRRWGEKREDWDQTLSFSALIVHQCWHFRVFYIMSECGCWKYATDTVVLRFSCGKSIWMCLALSAV